MGHRLGFKSGPFVLAIQSARAVLPVAIRGASASLAPRAQLRLRPGLVTVEVLDPIPVSGLGLGDRKALREATRGAILDALGPEDGGRGLPRGPDVPPCPQTHADLAGPPTRDGNVVSVSYIQAAPGAE